MKLADDHIKLFSCFYSFQPWACSISRRAYVAIRREWKIEAKRYTYWATSGDDARSL